MEQTMTDDLLADAFERLLQTHCTPAHVREIENGASPDVLWEEIEQSGFADALLSEDKGGADLALRDVFPLVLLCGRYALPVPMAETMVARAAFAAAGQEVPKGPIAWSDDIPFETPELRRSTGALVAAGLLVGALERAFEITVEFANDRTQFGRPIGKFQAVQQLLSIMAEQTFAAKMAAEIGFASDGWMPDPLLAALAKSRSSDAAALVSAHAHAVHGAIGATEEYDLQLFTRRIQQGRTAFGSETYWNRLIGETVIASGEDGVLDNIRQNMSA
jgi:acyl-CoA dehydrogenase